MATLIDDQTSFLVQLNGFGSAPQNAAGSTVTVSSNAFDSEYVLTFGSLVNNTTTTNKETWQGVDDSDYTLQAGAVATTFAISNVSAGIPIITGTFPQDTDAAGGRTELKRQLDTDSEFSARMEFVKDTEDDSERRIARYQTRTDTDISNFVFTVQAGGGSNTTPYLNVHQSGAFGGAATVVTLTSPAESISLASNQDSDAVGAAIVAAVTDTNFEYDSATDRLQTGTDTTISVANPNTLTFTEL